MQRWRISQRNWEIDFPINEWNDGNTVIFSLDVTQEGIDEAVKDLREQIAWTGEARCQQNTSREEQDWS